VGNTSAEHTSGPITLGQQWVRLFLWWLAASFTVPLYMNHALFLQFWQIGLFYDHMKFKCISKLIGEG
jgi:hypothetical protein